MEKVEKLLWLSEIGLENSKFSVSSDNMISSLTTSYSLLCSTFSHTEDFVKIRKMAMMQSEKYRTGVWNIYF